MTLQKVHTSLKTELGDNEKADILDKELKSKLLQMINDLKSTQRNI
jgi:hypothetical protein